MATARPTFMCATITGRRTACGSATDEVIFKRAHCWRCVIPAGFAYDANDLDLNEKGSMLRRSGRLAPPKLGRDGKPVPRSPQEQKDEELYQWNRMAEPLTNPIVAFRNQGNLKFEDAGPAW